MQLFHRRGWRREDMPTSKRRCRKLWSSLEVFPQICERSLQQTLDTLALAAKAGTNDERSGSLAFWWGSLGNFRETYDASGSSQTLRESLNCSQLRQPCCPHRRCSSWSTFLARSRLRCVRHPPTKATGRHCCLYLSLSGFTCLHAFLCRQPRLEQTAGGFDHCCDHDRARS